MKTTEEQKNPARGSARALRSPVEAAAAAAGETANSQISQSFKTTHPVGHSWKIRVAVKDGENAASVDADKVAALFEASCQSGDWTEATLLPLSVTAKGTDGDTLLFDVTPSEESAPGVFFRLVE